ncbi:hypothetical protein DWZ21_03545 [Hungatella hathewayi]|nr:hypothetical protein DWZ21_03545 [Hungatella hathewayi]
MLFHKGIGETGARLGVRSFFLSSGCTGDVLGLYWGCTGDVLELFGDSWGFVCLNLPASYCFVIAVCRCF